MGLLSELRCGNKHRPRCFEGSTTVCAVEAFDSMRVLQSDALLSARCRGERVRRCQYMITAFGFMWYAESIWPLLRPSVEGFPLGCLGGRVSPSGSCVERLELNFGGYPTM